MWANLERFKAGVLCEALGHVERAGRVDAVVGEVQVLQVRVRAERRGHAPRAPWRETVHTQLQFGQVSVWLQVTYFLYVI